MTSRFGFGSKMNKWLSFRIIKYFRTVLLLIGGKVLLHCWISKNIFGNCLLLLNDVILSKSTKMLFKVDYKKKRINRALMLIMTNFIRNVFGNYLNNFCFRAFYLQIWNMWKKFKVSRAAKSDFGELSKMNEASSAYWEILCSLPLTIKYL